MATKTPTAPSTATEFAQMARSLDDIIESHSASLSRRECMWLCELKGELAALSGYLRDENPESYLDGLFAIAEDELRDLRDRGLMGEG